MASEPSGRFAVYKQRLSAISARTGAPLPSLILSFGILHELTAIIPIVGIFYGARTFGVGEHVVWSILEDEQLQKYCDDTKSTKTLDNLTYAKLTMKRWVEEGDQWAIRIGRRYGIFGYEKRQQGVKDDVEGMVNVSGHLAGDVANVVFAYGVTKALLPLRIGASIYLSPMFSRGVVEPIRKAIIRPFRRSS
ncbi:hypothetical protein CPB83DRAFT_764483 [Crepidotus variabilis]|uniref:Uncharacterized protein n=1 Tax=Crepidotus variabilis TaxID=179855 RepID=A0A9P6JQY4_9AGAR|nr:hypothetical protein CPB83DRAFT_764483 [Crepidotus variabilis]